MRKADVQIGEVYAVKVSGKVAPVVLDEAAWNLLSLEYIQDYATEVRRLDGGVAPGFETYTDSGPGQGVGTDPLPYYMRKVTGYFSFAASAAFAQAARLFEPFDKKRADRYLQRAERGSSRGRRGAGPSATGADTRSGVPTERPGPSQPRRPGRSPLRWTLVTSFRSQLKPGVGTVGIRCLTSALSGFSVRRSPFCISTPPLTTDGSRREKGSTAL